MQGEPLPEQLKVPRNSLKQQHLPLPVLQQLPGKSQLNSSLKQQQLPLPLLQQLPGTSQLPLPLEQHLPGQSQLPLPLEPVEPISRCPGG